MRSNDRFWFAACLVVFTLSTTIGTSTAQQWDPPQAVRSSITILDMASRSKQVLHSSPHRLEAPNWSPDGSYLVLNGGGKLWRLPVQDSSPPRIIPTGSLGWIDINHGISPDGRSLAISSGPIFRLRAGGSAPVQLTSTSPCYFQSWSPDGRRLVYTAIHGGNVDLATLDLATGAQTWLTADPAIDDTPDFSADGRSLYFTSTRALGAHIWRIPASDNRPADSRAERITQDDLQDWFPHPSPDGKSIVFLSYPKGTQGIPPERDVRIRRMPLPDARPSPMKGKIEQLARLVGGKGSLGSRPWSPDGKRLAYVSYQPPPPTLHIIFFTPAGVQPPAGVAHRLNEAAQAAEQFFVKWMKHWNYPPANEQIFTRAADRSVQILYVQGDRRASFAGYLTPNFATFGPDIISQASRKYQIPGSSHVWWIFTYLGDPPARISEYRGDGTSQNGGWAIVNYAANPGEIRPDLGLETGFNSTFTLKGCIHELGHALGLPHIGPTPSLGLGDSLMGPNNSDYAQRSLPHPYDVYLTEAAAAILWKHPLFSRDSSRRALVPDVKLTDYNATFDRKTGHVAISGKVTADLTAHSVIVLDDLGQQADYWYRSAASRVAKDGTFRVTLTEPGRSPGTYRILFAFDNGAVTGDRDNPAYYGAIIEPHPNFR